MVARLCLILCCLTLIGCSPRTGQALKIQKGESIAFIGNTFAEQMYRYGFFETMLHCRFPQHQLRIRNLGWSADEITMQPRPAGFGDLHQQLRDQQAGMVFACFGLNESFRGKDHLPRFRMELTAFVQGLREQKYNGSTAPRVVLVSPIAHETNSGHNAILKLYADTMAEVAKQLDVRFVDLLTPTLARLDSKDAKRLTRNGIHLTQFGYWTVSRMLAEALGLTSDPGSEQATDGAAVAALRCSVVDKNRAFFLLWHGPNMEYVHGRRNKLPGADGLPAERARLTKIVDQLDARISAADKPGPASIWSVEPPALPLWVTPPDYAGLEGDSAKPPAIPAHYRINKPAAALAEFIPAEGYKINLFASEADSPIANPVAMQFDTKGRLWVACSRTWPHPAPGQRPADSIVILEDTDRDGKADRHTVFVDQLPMIHGFALGNGGAYISQTPDLIFAADTDGDGRADRFEPVLHGFGSEDVEHSINNLRWGPDGALYFMEGIFHHTQVETPHGPRRLRDGGVFRFDPRTHRFDILASYAFWNPWGQAFDRNGLHLVLDASSHDFFPTSILSAPFRYPKNKRNKHDQLSFAPNGLGPAAGLELVRSRHFPDMAQGRLLVNQLSADFRGTRWFDLKDRGTSFEASELETPLVFSTDNNCRPLALAFGPDGALYILDFASGLIENTSESKRDPGRDHAHGRVWRLTYPARPLQEPATIEGATPIELLDMLESPDQFTSELARRVLHESDPDATMQAVATWLAGFAANSSDLEVHRLHALWIQQGLGRVQDELLRQVLGAKTAPVRAAGLRVLRFRPADDSFDDVLARLAVDPDPRVRLEAVLACGTSTSARAQELALLATGHPVDAGMRHALGEVMDFLETRHPRPNDTWPEDPRAQTYLISRMSNHELVQLASTTPSETVLTQLATKPLLDTTLRATACSKLATLRKIPLARQIYDLLVATEHLPDASAQVGLATMLAAAPPDQLTPMQEQLVKLTKAPHVETVRQAGFASLLATGRSLVQVRELTSRGQEVLIEMLSSIDMVPEKVRAALYEEVMSILTKKRETDAVRGAAILALAIIPGDRARTFNSIVGELTQGIVDAGARALFRLPRRYWQTELAGRTLDGIMEFLDNAPARDRGTPAFKQSLRAGFELAQFLEGDKAAEMHKRLTDLGPVAMTVRVVPHLMLFDKTEIIAEAGKRIELTLENPGVMNHNLVIVAPGKLAEVGSLSDRLVAAGGASARNFIPDSPDILAASGIAAPRGRSTLVFNAPSTPGNYPFLCTIPGHWSRMNGILKVIARGKTATASYSDVAFVRSWKTQDIDHILKKLGVGKTKAGADIFTRLCKACHTVRGKGGMIGPDLTGTASRLSLSEMIEHTIAPAKSIDPQFQIHAIDLVAGGTLFGRIANEDPEAIYLIENPLALVPPRKIWRKDITRTTPSQLSTMPQGLLNTLKRRQILDLMAYIRAEN